MFFAGGKPRATDARAGATDRINKQNRVSGQGIFYRSGIAATGENVLNSSSSQEIRSSGVAEVQELKNLDSGGDFPREMPVPALRIKTLLAYSATPATPDSRVLIPAVADWTKCVQGLLFAS